MSCKNLPLSLTFAARSMSDDLLVDEEVYGAILSRYRTAQWARVKVSFTDCMPTHLVLHHEEKVADEVLRGRCGGQLAQWDAMLQRIMALGIGVHQGMRDKLMCYAQFVTTRNRRNVDLRELLVMPLDELGDESVAAYTRKFHNLCMCLLARVQV